MCQNNFTEPLRTSTFPASNYTVQVKRGWGSSIRVVNATAGSNTFGKPATKEMPTKKKVLVMDNCQSLSANDPVCNKVYLITYSPTYSLPFFLGV